MFIPIDRRRLLAWLLGAPGVPAGAALRAGAVPPPLMLAREAPPDIDPAGWLVSEKYDGVRAHWDGAVLRFRSGLPVAAPGWFTQRLPAQPLDGELWCGRGRFEALVAVVRRRQPDDDAWRALRYMVFDLPAAPGPFERRARRVESIVPAQRFEALGVVAQQRLDDRAALARRYAEVLRAGGEGLVLHRADALWRPGRSDALLKLKPRHDADGVVLAHLPGRGRHALRLGSLRVRNDAGVEFLLGSGLSDVERAAPPRIGSIVTYTYRDLTAAGVPRFASFLRLREP